MRIDRRLLAALQMMGDQAGRREQESLQVATTYLFVGFPLGQLVQHVGLPALDQHLPKTLVLQDLAGRVLPVGFIAVRPQGGE